MRLVKLINYLNKLKMTVQQFKKANKERKLKLAIAAGYKTAEEYLSYLECNTSQTEKVAKKASKKVTMNQEPIHLIQVLDCSASMGWQQKITTANNAINTNFKELADGNYVCSLVHFSSHHDIITDFVEQPIKNVKPINYKSRGNTALWDAIGQAFKLVKKDQKVIMSIYTDGEENDSKEFTVSKIKELISSNKNVTFTFIGTDKDVLDIQDKLGIDESNTLSYDGTAAGLEKSLKVQRVATENYAKRSMSGQDVSKGFYKRFDNK
jgi:uncharacterized protein YegL